MGLSTGGCFQSVLSHIPLHVDAPLYSFPYYTETVIFSPAAALLNLCRLTRENGLILQLPMLCSRRAVLTSSISYPLRCGRDTHRFRIVAAFSGKVCVVATVGAWGWPPGPLRYT
jgi:hypothetical protein